MGTFWNGQISHKEKVIYDYIKNLINDGVYR